MKRLVILIAIIFFLVSLVAAIGIDTGAINSECSTAGGACVSQDCKGGYYENSSLACNLESERCCMIKVPGYASSAVPFKNGEDRVAATINAEIKARERTTINAEVTGAESKIEIEKIFYTTINQDNLVAEIISKFSLDKSTADNLLKIETNNEEQNNIGLNVNNEGEDNNSEIEAEEQEQLKVEVEVNNQFTFVEVKMEFVLNSTNRDDILNAIVDKSQLTADDVKNAMEINDLKEVTNERNRLGSKDRIITQCPDVCTCSGSVMKCQLANGREMTIYAGESGNVIVQVKGENMTTNVTLYKSNDKLYGVFENNETREVKVLPDQVKEKVKEKLSKMLEDENISLNEDGDYNYQGTQNASLFFIIPVKVHVKAEIDSKTGEIVNLKANWWAFLAKDNSQQIVGASCAAVTPGLNNACCKNKGYDYWNVTNADCEFNASI